MPKRPKAASPLSSHLDALRSLRNELDVARDAAVAGIRGLAKLVATSPDAKELPEVRNLARAIDDVDDGEVPAALDRLIRVLQATQGLRAVAGTATSRTAVLIAEDDRVTSSLLVHRLERERYKVVHVTDGLEALRAATAETFDLVVLDVKMPGMDGFEVLKELRSLPQYDDTPVLMLTSLGGEEQVVHGLQLGANDYMTKPFSPLELVARIQRLLRHAGPAA